MLSLRTIGGRGGGRNIGITSNQWKSDELFGGGRSATSGVRPVAKVAGYTDGKRAGK